MNEAQKALELCKDFTELLIYTVINSVKSERYDFPFGNCTGVIYTFKDDSIIRFLIKDGITILQAEEFENEGILTSDEYPHID